MADPTQASDTLAIIETVKQLHGVDIKTLEFPAGGAAAIAIVPEGMNVESLKTILDEFREKPQRRAGKVPISDLASFVEYVNRFKDGDTAIFADDKRDAPRLISIIDYHRAGFTGDPAWLGHRAIYEFPLSDEWKVWHGKDGQKMSQGEFAEFLEDHIGDVQAPPLSSDGLPGGDPLIDQLLIALGGMPASPARLMELARGLSITSNDKVAQAINLQSGEAAISYQSTHTDGNGSKISVPPLFLIGIPVFRNGHPYRIAARLRYRLAGAGLSWFFQLYRTDKVFDHAFSEAVETVKTGTGAVTFIGKPE